MPSHGSRRGVPRDQNSRMRSQCGGMGPKSTVTTRRWMPSCLYGTSSTCLARRCSIVSQWNQVAIFAYGRSWMRGRSLGLMSPYRTLRLTCLRATVDIGCEIVTGDRQHQHCRGRAEPMIAGLLRRSGLQIDCNTPKKHGSIVPDQQHNDLQTIKNTPRRGGLNPDPSPESYLFVESISSRKNRWKPWRAPIRRHSCSQCYADLWTRAGNRLICGLAIGAG